MMGTLTIQFPESLHRRLEALAAKEGVPLDQFVVLAASERATRYEAEARQITALKQRARQHAAELQEQGLSPSERVQALLDKGPEEKPREEDQLP